MSIIDFTEIKLRDMVQDSIKKGDDYGRWAMEEILQMYLERTIDIRWQNGLPVPDVILTETVGE
jgi:hypothetical protein